MPAFQSAARHGWAFELDVRLTRDRVPIVMHDETLGRTTRCHGRVRAHTFHYIRSRCRVDRLGVPGGRLGTRRTRRRVMPPTLAVAASLATRRHVTLVCEIKGWDPSRVAVRAVVRALRRSRLPHDRLVVQSFDRRNLTAVHRRMRGVRVAQLTRAHAPQVVLSGAFTRIVAPPWPVSAAFVERSHAAGVLVAPYTLDRRSEIERARDAGVDQIVTDDPSLTARTLR